MTAEEQAAADAAAAKAKADADAAAHATEKKYSEEEFKKVVAERQEAKEKLRAIEEANKKAADEKAKAEGKLSELLAEREKELATLKSEKETLATEAAKFRETQEALKKSLLEKITDADLKKFGEKLSLDELPTYVEKVAGQKIGGGSKLQLGALDKDFFTREEVARMSKEEVKANLEKVNKSMSKWT